MTPVQLTIAHAMPWSGVRAWLPRPGEWFEIRDFESWVQARCRGVRVTSPSNFVIVSYETWPRHGGSGSGSAFLSQCRRGVS